MSFGTISTFSTLKFSSGPSILYVYPNADSSMSIYYTFDFASNNSIPNYANIKNGVTIYDGLIIPGSAQTCITNTLPNYIMGKGALQITNVTSNTPNTATQYVQSYNSINTTSLNNAFTISLWVNPSSLIANKIYTLFDIATYPYTSGIRLDFSGTNMFNFVTNTNTAPLTFNSISLLSKSITINYTNSVNTTNYSYTFVATYSTTTISTSGIYPVSSLTLNGLLPLTTYSTNLNLIFNNKIIQTISNSYSTILDSPTNVALLSGSITSSSVQIVLTDPSGNGNIISYTTNIGTLTGTNSPYTITGLTSSSLYNTITIRAISYFSGTTTIGYSSVVTIPSFTTTPNPPTNITYIANSITDNSISFSFTAPTGTAPITGYITNIGTGSGTPSNYTISNLNFNNSTNYNILIASTTATGVSQYVTAITSAQLYNAYLNRNLSVYYAFDTSLNSTTPDNLNIIANNTFVYDASFIGSATLTPYSNIGTRALSLTNSSGASSNYIISNLNGNSITTNTNTGFSVSCWINTLGISNSRTMCIFDIPLLLGQKGISVDISGNNTIYISEF